VYRVCTVYSVGLAGPHCHVLLLFEQDGVHGVHDVHSGGSDRAHPCVPGIAVLLGVRGMQGGGRAGVHYALVPVHRAGDHAEGLQWVR
jgi:hypothetical protein